MKLISSSWYQKLHSIGDIISNLFLMIILILGIFSQKISIIALVILFTCIIWFLKRSFVGDIAKKVYLDNETIIVEKHKTKLFIDFKNIQFIKHQQSAPPIIIIYTLNGGKERFIPHRTLFKLSPEVTFLLEKFNFDSSL